MIYHLLPYRRLVMLDNLRRVFGRSLPEAELRCLAKANYAHIVRFLLESCRMQFMSSRQRKSWIRVENMESPLGAQQQGKGIILLTGHFGNWDVSCMAGLVQFPRHRNLFHVVRRQTKPRLLDRLINRRFRRAGFGILPKKGSLNNILNLLKRGLIVVYPFDQHAEKRDGVAVDFCGHPAGTFKSVALLALTTGAAVVPAFSWREPDGSHVLRFDDPLPLIDCADAGEAVRRNTRAYNAAVERMLLLHPEQWIWMHRRWKIPAA